MAGVFKNVSLVQSDFPVTIGILYVGEPQIRKLIRQLIGMNIDAEIYLYSNYKNSEAHEKLYRQFNNLKQNLRIKLDADMTVSSQKKFLEAIAHGRELTDHCNIYRVKDYFTNSLINGVHFYASEFIIDTESIDFNSPFVDQFKCSNINYYSDAFINHGEDYTLEQRKDFIIHRLRKSLKSGSFRRKIRYFKIALECCNSVSELINLMLDSKVYLKTEYKQIVEDQSTIEFFEQNKFVRI